MGNQTDFLRKCFALTGSIATGKSVVAAMFTGMGAYLIDTDLIARQVVEPGQPAFDDIVKQFGGQYLRDDGTLDREKMRDLIIRDQAERERLNSITHPRINEIVFTLIRDYNARNQDIPIIIDVPLLYEAGWDRLFPEVILVYAPVEVQVERLMKRDSIDRETALVTVRAQMGIEDKKKLAAHIIDNSGSLEETRTQVEGLFSLLRERIAP